VKGCGTREFKGDRKACAIRRFTALVIQTLLGQLSARLVHHRNLLIARVKITAYNPHCSAPFSEPWSSYNYQVYSEEGADNVI